MCGGSYGGQKRALDSMELELKQFELFSVGARELNSGPLEEQALLPMQPSLPGLWRRKWYKTVCRIYSYGSVAISFLGATKHLGW